jgi:hypothetical protein
MLGDQLLDEGIFTLLAFHLSRHLSYFVSRASQLVIDLEVLSLRILKKVINLFGHLCEPLTLLSHLNSKLSTDLLFILLYLVLDLFSLDFQL